MQQTQKIYCPKILTTSVQQIVTNFPPRIHLFLSGSLLARVTLHPARLLHWHQEPDVLFREEFDGNLNDEDGDDYDDVKARRGS